MKKRKKYREWAVVVGGAAPVFLRPGAQVTVTGNVTVTAVWEDDDPYDINLDRRVDISDVTELLNILSGSSAAVVNCDLSGNGSVDIADVTALLDRLSA